MGKGKDAEAHAKPHGFTVRRAKASPGQVLICEAPYQRNAEWEKWVLLRSDAHHDHPSSDHEAQREHLELAKARGAGVADIGDLACAMQGKYDPRSSKSAMPTRYPQGPGAPPYLDWIVDDAAGFLEPYRGHFLMLSPGNHESSILKRQETDLSTRLADRLGCARQSMQGWILFRFHEPFANARSRSNRTQTLRLAYHHGYGGGGPVTKDVIQSHRKNAYTDGADIVWSGHTHDTWHHIDTMWSVSDTGEVRYVKRHQIKTGGYKSEHRKGEGWAVEKGMPPKTNGAAWLRFFWNRKRQRIEVEVRLALT